MQANRRLELIEQECQIRTNLKQIQFTHYFSNQFMEKNTQFFSIEEFLESLGVTSQATLENLSINNWDQKVQQSTIFTSWQEMLNQAGNEYSINNSL
ncbi:hypothetical protein LCR01_03130 [Companilactobacillus crustorum]|uniref:Uncharacterized protein n=3 Tax=Companilactobacillus TaxID=2767879 RepID=A0A837RKX0_9LACO|nr:hypothetical protein [Companilactobacillus crustorum]HCD07128.1 hypothetical protein [Lactobacillus sp.]APU71247.1 hypothetical protein BI355_0928 [Companilactobacillus crustorum]KRK43968.1 hypothetical protein FD26_GL001453 [Companilactobacillus crustorum JCM 15951]KRO21408.1 hypothetical protein IV63_GL001542 [Companilactobacillus crustorum]WDT66717.1 hypothetical protein NV391_05805 [Companilactobacillus crustorum]